MFVLLIISLADHDRDKFFAAGRISEVSPDFDNLHFWQSFVEDVHHSSYHHLPDANVSASEEIGAAGWPSRRLTDEQIVGLHVHMNALAVSNSSQVAASDGDGNHQGQGEKDPKDDDHYDGSEAASGPTTSSSSIRRSTYRPPSFQVAGSIRDSFAVTQKNL